MSAKCRLLVSPRRAVGAEDDFQRTVFAHPNIGHDVVEVRCAERGDLLTRAESLRAECAHIYILIGAVAVRRVEKIGSVPRFDERRTALAACGIGTVGRTLQHFGRAPSARRALPRKVHIAAAAWCRAVAVGRSL